ncbi:hypothetical protein Zmor_023453 [Zophobas morio]|uniref:Ribosomal protein eL8/eL30/eS12/Gadd45 domain-containing protein n=1 Tax=Zophobas morio TaxID=2755281 RepID=A0AA38HY30_9CUCU|nr:hypothetical protein Zmor_023453 [Zophobas morio]
METPTITKKQAKSTLSGKKKKKTEVIKNVLGKPFQTFWPSLSPGDSNQLRETLEKFLPRLYPFKINIPYKKIQSIPKQERKTFRQTFHTQTQIEVNESAKTYIVFGVNDVSKLLENQEAASVLIEGQVQPRLFVQHIIDQAVLYHVPVLIVDNLKQICKNKCGISGAVVALKKSIRPDSELGIIQQTIFSISENYPVPENHINACRRTLDITTITIPDSEAGDECDLDDVKEKSEVKPDFHLKKEDKGKRVFVPQAPVKEKVMDFISLDSNCVNFESTNSKKIESVKIPYHKLKVKRVQGNKNRNKRKMEKFKKK